MKKPLPEWVVEPCDIDQAARALGICKRTLVDFIGLHPHYEKHGNKKLFYPEHIEALRAARQPSNPISSTASKANSGALERALRMCETPAQRRRRARSER